MKIMVFDVPAESGGALSVLNDFYNKYKCDTQNEYVFIVSIPQLKNSDNIKVLQFPWIKRSWLHRIYFDYFKANKLVNKYKPDKVLSLQNLVIPRCNTYQTLYLHNSLPFTEHRFRLLDNKLLWTYQNIIGKMIFRSIRKADKVIVQANWMKEEIKKKLNIDVSKIEVNTPVINIENTEVYDSKLMKTKTFFYPASAVFFKNHKVIVDALILLKDHDDFHCKVIFTLKGNENEHIAALNEIVEKYELPVDFIGPITRAEVFEYYRKSILLFPSYIESSPLPLTEAKMLKTPIIASDFKFSKEILSGYNDVEFFDAFDPADLAGKLKNCF